MQLKDSFSRLDPKKKQHLGEVLRFIIVGGLATLLQYGIYLIFLPHVGEHYAMTIGYIISFVFNYFATTYFTFKVKASAKRGFGFAFSHGVNYLLQMLCLSLFVWLGVDKKLAPIPMFCICVPVNFLLVRLFLKR